MPVAARSCADGHGMPSRVRPLGDGEDAVAGEELGEDPLDHDGGWLVAGEDVQALAVGGLGRVGVRPGVDQLVAVGRPAAEEAAFDLGLGGHGGADADLDPVALAFGQAAEDGHDQVVGLVGRVDRAADLGHPQRHAVVLEQREGVAELVAVERPLRLADHDGVEAAVRGRRARRGAGWPRGGAAAGSSGTCRCRRTRRRSPRRAARSACLARAYCQAREDSGSCWSSVETRSQNANRIVLSVMGITSLPGRSGGRGRSGRVGLEQDPEQGPGRCRGERGWLVRQHHADGSSAGAVTVRPAWRGPALRRACEGIAPGAFWEGASRGFVASG